MPLSFGEWDLKDDICAFAVSLHLLFGVSVLCSAEVRYFAIKGIKSDVKSC